MSESAEARSPDEIKGIPSSQLVSSPDGSPVHVGHYSGIGSPIGRSTTILLFIADALWSSLVVFPLLVLYWSGTWFLFDVYLWPKNPTYSSVISLSAGMLILLLAYFAHPLLGRHIPAEWSLKHILVSRCLIYITALGVLLYFRGIWDLVDVWVQGRIEISIGLVVGSQIALYLLRASVNAAGSPLIVQIDTSEDFYAVSTRFKTSIDSILYYTLDVLLTVPVILSLIVLLWVGLWQLGDAFIFPHSALLSYVVCLGAGYACLVVLFAVQYPLEALLDNLSVAWTDEGRLFSRCAGVCIEATYNFVSTVVVLLLWRGLWGFIKTFVLVDATHLRLGWAFHAVGFVGMILLQVGKTLGSVGCAVDGESVGRLGSIPGSTLENIQRLTGSGGSGEVQARKLVHRVQYFTVLHQHRRRTNYSVNRTDNDSTVSETSTLLNNELPATLLQSP